MAHPVIPLLAAVLGLAVVGKARERADERAKLTERLAGLERELAAARSAGDGRAADEVSERLAELRSELQEMRARVTGADARKRATAATDPNPDPNPDSRPATEPDSDPAPEPTNDPAPVPEQSED